MSLVARPQPSAFASGEVVLADLAAVCLRVCLLIEVPDPFPSMPTGNKNPGFLRPGSKIETSDLLAGCLTWPQAGRLKSPRRQTIEPGAGRVKVRILQKATGVSAIVGTSP